MIDTGAWNSANQIVKSPYAASHTQTKDVVINQVKKKS